MILENPIEGRHIRLRTAEAQDAAFALSLRLNPALNRFLKPVNPSLELQQAWIESKKYQTGDYHMIIESLDNQPLGVVALYDINDGVFDWGRWVVDPTAPYSTAMESLVLLYYLGFEVLKLQRSDFEVRKGNKDVLRFHPSYGAEHRGEDNQFVYFRFSAEAFRSERNRLLNRWKRTLGIQAR